MKKDIGKIPKGMYCHRPSGRNDVCPYWSMDETRPKQENGYCSYLEKGDWDINEEANKHEQTVIHCDPKKGDKKVVYVPGTLPFPFNRFGLLWDQCKECGINNEYEE